MSSTSDPYAIAADQYATCRVEDCGEVYVVPHTARWLSRWSSDVEKCKGIILPLVQEFGTYDTARVICPMHLMQRETEYNEMARTRGKAKAEQTAPAVNEEENTMSDDSNFNWDEAGDNGAVATEQPAETPEAVEAKAPERLLTEEFPVGKTVKFTKTDWKSNYGEITGHEDKRNVLYVAIKLTHYATGKSRPADKQTATLVRPSSIELSDIPEAPAEPETAPAEG